MAEDASPRLECGYMDIRELHRIERSLQRSLAAATLEQSSGEIFPRHRSLAALAAEVKNPMLEFLDKQPGLDSSSKIDESAAPSAAVNELLEQFVLSRRNLLRRMSSKIGIGAGAGSNQEEEILRELHGVWDRGQCQSVARSLLVRLDHRQGFHCRERDRSMEELAVHKENCRFRPVACENDGCGDIFSALDAQSHDQECPLKLLDCKQGCGEKVARMEMERHCSTVCPMKMVNCPFSRVGCSHFLPQGALEQHHSSMQTTHLLFVLDSLQKDGVGLENVGQRLAILEKSMSLSERISAADVKALSITVKEQEAKIKKLEAEIKKLSKESTKSSTDLSAKVARIEKNVHV